jgi:hypothetical protein
VRPEWELVYIVAALERLFDCRRGREDDVAIAFTAALIPSQNLEKNEFALSKQSLVKQKFEHVTTIREIWMRDFFRFRGHLAHGSTESKQPQIWSLMEHLLLSSFAFPVAVKSLLAKTNAYKLTDADKIRLESFERLAAIELFPPRERSSIADFPWNKVFKEFGWRRLLED